MTLRERLGAGFVYLALGVAILLALFPFWWMLATSLKRPVDIFSGVALWPQQITFDNYDRLFNDYHFGYFLLNSVVDRGRRGHGKPRARHARRLCAGPLSPAVTASRKMALYLVLLVRMLPGIMLCVPLYIVLATWGLLNTRLGLILIYAGLNTSFVVWMMQSFLEEIPRDIEEAAMVDGDSRLTALWRIVIPLAAPGLIATAIFSVITTYNDFIIALTLTSTPDAQTDSRRRLDTDRQDRDPMGPDGRGRRRRAPCRS